ncbi:MAG: HAD family phosphatase [Maritimibacter sp.]|nr:HAD family phosphatase [Maritimibacter sp.]MCB1356465.1 HAD family phosphatase [Maritimibacter sp.]
MTLTALLWDLDGTLVDSEPAHGAAFDDALAELGLAVAPDFHARMLGVNEAGVHEALVAETGATIGLAEWSARKWAHYRRHAEDIRRREPVAAVAEDWAARGMPCAVVSNSTADEVAIALAATGLDAVLTTTVTFADVTRGKPDPEGYLLGASRLGVAPASCLVIEDSPVGAAAGRAAGMRVVYHPQTPADDPATRAPGAHYLAPDGDLAALVAHAMTTGDLP